MTLFMTVEELRARAADLRAEAVKPGPLARRAEMIILAEKFEERAKRDEKSSSTAPIS
jgi:hypothetical protein